MKEILHNVSMCCDSPCKYRKGTRKDNDEEVMVPFCCECERITTQHETRLSKQKKEENKNMLWRSIFPGINNLKP